MSGKKDALDSLLDLVLEMIEEYFLSDVLWKMSKRMKLRAEGKRAEASDKDYEKDARSLDFVSFKLDQLGDYCDRRVL